MDVHLGAFTAPIYLVDIAFMKQSLLDQKLLLGICTKRIRIDQEGYTCWIVALHVSTYSAVTIILNTVTSAVLRGP